MFTFSILVAHMALTQTMASYVMTDSINPVNFLDAFEFFSGADPTRGFVQYVDRASAESAGLISVGPDSIYIGVDCANVAPFGRASVRLASKTSFNSGLIVLDLKHMPGGICGTWPAFWTLGPDWPEGYFLHPLHRRLHRS